MFRNREVTIQIVVEGILTILAAVGCYFLNPICSLIVLALGAALIASHIISLRKRYDKIRQLCANIDSILHGESEVLVSDSTEGELSILNSEVHKMTNRLKLQSEQLLGEKIRLTHAIEDIFHQMRTPLTSMNVMISLLAEEDIDYEKRVRLTRELKKQTKRMQWLVETLLKMSKIDAGTASFQQDLVSMKELIESSVEPLLIPLELKDVSLNISCDESELKCDKSWMTEALGNIVKNCMEHTPMGGSIEINAFTNAICSEITIKDSGEGFDKEDIPYLFDRFYKGANASAESIGIGLALSRTIITAQNGTIAAANNSDGGAVFKIKMYKGIV